MIEQQTPDREKKIAEIREGYKSERDDNFTYKKEIVEQDIRFLLSELERLEREREKMIKALKFYANENNWRSGFVLGLAQADSGERAQTILDEIGVMVE